MPLCPPNPYEELAQLAGPEPPYDEPDEPPLIPAIPAIPADPIAAPSARPSADPSAGPGDNRPPAPPGHRRAGRRGSRRGRAKRRARRGTRQRWTPSPFRLLRRVVKLLLFVTAGAALLFLADRCAAMYAEKKAQQQLQHALRLTAEPQVDIKGFPFLTQVAAKRLDRVDVTVPHVAADRVTLARVRASARDIRLTGSLPTAIRGAVIGDLSGEVLLAFADMDRELGASQVRFRDLGGDSIGALGRLNVAGQELVVRAQAHLRRDGGHAITTEIDGMSLDLPHVATYRPGGQGPDDRRSLVLHREAAERIAKDAARVKALFSVPAIAERLGVPEEAVGTPRFLDGLTRLNLVDVLVEHPWLLEKLGIDPGLLTALTRLQPPELADRFSFSFRMPREAEGLRLRALSVGADGIRAELSATGLAVGK
ncbi:LmeA family phospholipid-binding protein [Streptomyces abikoensis]|uniref:LmeA family phospholipid-binding protein n=1 Tax=Streptomyces abikoensis TaxID=97398 RepID=UPI0036BA80F3